MSRDQIIGWGLLILSIAIIIIYGYVLYGTKYDIALLKLTGMIAITGVFGILGWIGYTLATTPPPKPIEEIEKEIEEELKKLEQETTTQTQNNAGQSEKK